MGRNKNYDEAEVLGTLALLFAENGFEATSIDQIATATGMKRGSIYQAFGSKANLFRRSMDYALASPIDRDQLADLTFVAMWERAGSDPEVRSLAERAIAELETGFGKSLGEIVADRLHIRAGIEIESQTNQGEPTWPMYTSRTAT